MRRDWFKCNLLLVFIALPFFLVAQNNPTFALNGNINGSHELSFSASTAGENPAKLNLFNTNNNTSNTSMSLTYKWPFLGNQGDEGTYLYGKISVSSSLALPSGLRWTINTTVPSATGRGTSTGIQTLEVAQKNLVTGIWSTGSFLVIFVPTNVTASLTQILSVTNFADIHPTPNGAFQTFTVTFALDNQ